MRRNHATSNVYKVYKKCVCVTNLVVHFFVAMNPLLWHFVIVDLMNMDNMRMVQSLVMTLLNVQLAGSQLEQTYTMNTIESKFRNENIPT